MSCCLNNIPQHVFLKEVALQYKHNSNTKVLHSCIAGISVIVFARTTLYQYRYLIVVSMHRSYMIITISPSATLRLCVGGVNLRESETGRGSASKPPGATSPSRSLSPSEAAGWIMSLSKTKG